MKLVFASDHAGFELKEALKEVAADLTYDVEDVGAYTFDPNDDYPAYCARAAQLVAESPQMTRAVVIGGSGQGEAIMANRFKGVRAALYNGESAGARRAGIDELALSREHNDANVLALGARFLTLDEARGALAHWLATPYVGDVRHARRIAQIDELSP